MGNTLTNPGVLAFGEGLPAGSSITTFFQDETVIHVSCGDDHSAVVCESGRAYTFGKSQDSGWMANIDADEIVVPRLVSSFGPIRITRAACGYRYTLFLTDNGELYSCGLNDKGQLGLGHKDKVPTPVLVTGLPPIRKLAAGHGHSVVLTDSGGAWACGNNNHGQLGLGHTNNLTSFCQIRQLSEPIVDISCGSNHTALITASRVLFITGLNDDGQLGLGGVENVTTFKSVSTLSTAIAAVSCGYQHNVVLTKDGTCWAWGYNGCGQLSTETKDNRTIPTKVVGLEGQTVSQVIAGGNHTAVLTQEGDLWVWGRGTSGELGLGKQTVFSKPTMLTKSSGLVVQQVAFAGSYSLLLVVPWSTKTLRPQIGGTDKVDLPNDTITNEERKVMSSLECPVCMKIMCAPIHQCSMGHSLCGTCRASPHMTACPQCRSPLIDTRNITLESLIENIQVPCTECLVRGPASEAERHAKVCPRRT